jgi:hypothetical protein
MVKLLWHSGAGSVLLRGLVEELIYFVAVRNVCTVGQSKNARLKGDFDLKANTAVR